MRRYVAAVALLVCATLARADGFDYCLVCHGAQGKGNVAIRAPKIAGMEAWYVRRQLEAFASGLRGHAEVDAAGQEMRPIGIRLQRESSIDAAVQFVEALPQNIAIPTLSGDAAAGRRHYEACATCHGADGEGSAPFQAPKLAGQSDWYLVQQLRNYREDRRGTLPGDTFGAQMRAAARLLPDDRAVIDVVAYLNSLHQSKGASE